MEHAGVLPFLGFWLEDGHVAKFLASTLDECKTQSSMERETFKR